MASFTPPIQTAIKQAKDKEGDLVDNAAKELAGNVAVQLSKSEPIIGDFVKDNKVKIVPAFYDFHTGKVSLLP